MWLLGSMQWLLQVGLFSLRSTLRRTVQVFCFSKLIVGGAPVTSWVYRACIVQGTQQIFAAGLWYWGHRLSVESAAGDLDPNNITTPTVTFVTWCLSVLLLATGVSLHTGLPDYYRQLPGRIPAFYKSLTRRKLVLVRLLIFLRNPDLLVVFRSRHPPEFLVECSIRTELVVLVEWRCAGVANCPVGRDIFRRCMGLLSLGSGSAVKKSFMESTRVCYWPWRTEMVSNALGCDLYWI